MTMLWTMDELVAATGGRPLGTMPEGVSGISIDTRSLVKGDAFFAIKGERFDGHDFATAAMAAGAGLLVVAEERLPALGRLAVPKLVVPDVLKALEDLGRAARARSKAKVIAVTGSAGKTTTKEMLRCMLSAVGSVHAADRSFNNHWGVPLTLARLPADSDFAVIEIGMNHPGEIRTLVKMARPHVAVVTMVAAAHIGFFKSIDDIARAKAEIFEGLVRGGHALINRDDKRWKLLSTLAEEAGAKSIWGFGENARAQIRLLDVDLGEFGSTAAVRLEGQTLSLSVGAPGRHMVQNAAAALGAVHLAGGDASRAVAALSGFYAEEGRGARHRLALGDGAFTLIDESYNANPASMGVAFELMARTRPEGDGRRIAVLGDMAELGSHAAKLHAGLSDQLVAARPDLVFLAGKDMKALAEVLPKELAVKYSEAIDDIIEPVMGAVRAGDTVMVKSSKSIGLKRLVDALLKTHPEASTGD